LWHPDGGEERESKRSSVIKSNKNGEKEKTMILTNIGDRGREKRYATTKGKKWQKEKQRR